MMDLDGWARLPAREVSSRPKTGWLMLLPGASSGIEPGALATVSGRHGTSTTHEGMLMVQEVQWQCGSDRAPSFGM